MRKPASKTDTLPVILKWMLAISFPLLIIQTQLEAQSWEHLLNSATDFYGITEKADDFFKNNPAYTRPGTGYNDYMRWKAFWMNRVDENGSLDSYQNEMFNTRISLVKSPPAFQQITWKCLGPTKSETTANYQIAYLGIVNELWVNPVNPSHLLAGSNSGGLFKTTDAGHNWQPLTDSYMIFGIQSIYVNPANNDEILIATGTSTMGKYYSQGIWKSTNGGTTWDETDFQSSLSLTSKNYVIKKLLVHPTDPNIMYAIYDHEFCTRAFVARSNNNGYNWQNIRDIQNSEIFIIEFKPGNPNILYIGGGDFVMRFDGQNWVDIKPPVGSGRVINRAELAVTEANPDLLMVLCQSYNPINPSALDYKTELYRSYDGGATYQRITCNFDTNKIGYWKMELKISPNNPDCIYIGGLFVYKYLISNNGVANNQNIPGFGMYHTDVRSMTVLNSGKAEHIYIGNDGGVTRSENGGSNWIDMSKNGLAITQFWGMGISDNSPVILCGPQDGNKCMYNYTTQTWVHKFGDAYNAVIDYQNPDKMYVASQGTLAVSTDGGNTYTYRQLINLQNQNELVGRNYALTMHPTNPNLLYIGLENVWTYDVTANQFTKISSFQVANAKRYALSSIAVSPSDPNVIYAARGNPQWGDQDKRRLFRTTDGGADWKDITPVNNWIQYTGISDIAVNPDNHKEIWISLHRNHNGIKVLHSPDGGQNWTNISAGLPNLPVNCIRYFKYTGLEGLVVGTDAGVYIRTTAMTQWEQLGNNLPLTIVSDIELYNNRPVIVAATFGRGVWEANLCELVSDIEINGNVTWSTDQTIYKNVRVKQGARLTITATIKMECCITVDIGGTLIIDGGHLTAVNRFWPGITVLGEPRQPHSKPDYHGKVVVKNGGKISNALTGISAGRQELKGEKAEPENGGIVQIDNAVFLNNRIAVALFPYEYSNFSFVRNSKFITDNTLPAEIYPECFIKLYGVKIQDVSGCTFLNDRNMGADDPARGSGIFALNSNLINSCSIPLSRCLSKHYKPNEFKNLFYGIEVLDVLPGCYISVVNSKFFNNYRGLYLSGIKNSKIIFNEFSITSAYQQNGGYGLYLDGCNGYEVDTNYFRSNSTTEQGLGLVVNESGGDPNEIYGNKFDLLQLGISCQGNNRGTTPVYPGLQLICNNIVGCTNDILISNPNQFPNPGIAKNQGSDGNNPKAAGNLFQISPNPEYNDINNNFDLITYWHPSSYNSNRVKPVKNQNVLTQALALGSQWTHQKNCPSKFNAAGSNPEYLAQLQVVISQISTLQQNYNLLMDGGNTPLLLDLVWYGTPNQVQQAYTQLMNVSPYVSDTVMIAAITRTDLLSDSLLCNIMVANPNTAKSSRLMQLLAQVRTSMPGYMIKLIGAGVGIVSEREAMESELGQLYLDKSWLVNTLAFNFYNDPDSLVLLWNTDNSISSKYSLAFHWLGQGEYAQGSVVLDSILVQFQLTNQQIFEHQLFVEYYAIMVSLHQKGKSIFGLDPAQITTVSQIASYNAGIVSVYARNILIALGLNDYEEPVYKLEETKPGGTKSGAKEVKVVKPALQISQDESVKIVIAEYIKPSSGSGQIVVENAKKKVVFSADLTQSEGHVVIMTESWSNGTYKVYLRDYGRDLASRKFTVKRR